MPEPHDLAREPNSGGSYSPDVSVCSERSLSMCFCFAVAWYGAVWLELFPPLHWASVQRTGDRRPRTCQSTMPCEQQRRIRLPLPPARRQRKWEDDAPTRQSANERSRADVLEMTAWHPAGSHPARAGRQGGAAGLDEELHRIQRLTGWLGTWCSNRKCLISWLHGLGSWVCFEDGWWLAASDGDGPTETATMTKRIRPGRQSEVLMSVTGSQNPIDFSL
ncbi:hypothetical protein LZ31DRAFT_371402 [Colletotrichum somersetense]|nr:hypothetical protein LZ31DRAFT_371402 [Colletotrichum somersetense]